MASSASKLWDMKTLLELDKENGALEDLLEKEIREKLLDAIWDKIDAYDNHICEYEYKQHIKALSDRGITFISIEKKPIEAQWDKLFTPLIIEQPKEPGHPYNDQFKWHLFSFGVLDALEEDEARETFDTIEKDIVYLFFQESEETYLVKNAFLLKSIDLDWVSGMNRSDFYVFDPVEKWTYAKTHTTCGPYFYQQK